MKRVHGVAVTVLSYIATVSASEFNDEISLTKRQGFEDSYKIYIRKRHAHACMMSIVFIVLFPLAAISLHLPLRGTRVVAFIHAPIQLLGLAMMIGAMGLGIDIAKNDLHYITPAKAHVVIGLLTTSMIILFQPAMGIYQHLHFKRTGKKSVFAYIHRWIGRIGIILGWINTGLGFQLYPWILVPNHVIVREYVLLGVLGGIWWALLGVDATRNYVLKKPKISSFAVTWRRGPRLTREERQPMAEVKESERGDSSQGSTTA
jgi:hypothetical protein